MDDRLFSTYRGGENRVTAALLAVLGRLSLTRIERLLAGLLEESEFELVQLDNQVAKGATGVPDAVIASSVEILIETKIRAGTVGEQQLRRHLQRLDGSTAKVRRLLVLTPDGGPPAVLDRIGDDRLIWSSFAALDQGIDGLLADPDEVVSEREQFLLRELQRMFVAEDLVGTTRDVVVVAARRAWPNYQRWHGYVCQPDRSFQRVAHMAFYVDGRIEPIVPRVVEVKDRIVLRRGLGGAIGAVVDRVLADQPQRDGDESKVFALSAPDDESTLRLATPVGNDLLAASGRTTAFTQNQRYVSSAELLRAQRTSQLDHQGGR